MKYIINDMNLLYFIWIYHWFRKRKSFLEHWKLINIYIICTQISIFDYPIFCQNSEFVQSCLAELLNRDLTNTHLNLTSIVWYNYNSNSYLISFNWIWSSEARLRDHWLDFDPLRVILRRGSLHPWQCMC